MKKQKIGIYGGTFSPPHVGHVSAAESFSEAIELDKLIIMPDFLPPHKHFDGEVTPEDRLNMCSLAFSHIKNAEVSDLEIKRGGKSYTAVTLEELSSADTELYFLCGTDMFLTLDKWYAPERIFKSAVICFIRREKDPENDLIIDKLIKEYESKFSAKIIEIPGKVIEISSSDVREALNGSEDEKEFLPDGVYSYIVEKGLYK